MAQALQKKMHKVGAKKREFGTCIGIRQVTPAQRKLFECKNEYWNVCNRKNLIDKEDRIQHSTLIFLYGYVVGIFASSI